MNMRLASLSCLVFILVSCQSEADSTDEKLESLLVPRAEQVRVSAEKTYIGSLSFTDAIVKIDPSFVSGQYKLELSDALIITYSNAAGLFYAKQSFDQLRFLFPETVPQLVISDKPSYLWRGSMIDVARHFRSVDYLKKHIERMAAFKLNKLHLHLTDDQGWRLQITNWPELTNIGASTGVGDAEGGFYSHEDIAELVTYAKKYQIDIIPEIDFPGHAQAALASYPELACEGVGTDIHTGINTGFSSLCLEKTDLINTFVTDVLTEVAGLFPSAYVHIGGDEIDDPRYIEFITQAEKIVTSLNKTMIGWEEISQAPLLSQTVMQHWRDPATLVEAQEKELSVILSPCFNTYLDHGNYSGQENTFKWCSKKGINLKQLYQLVPSNYSNVLGVEAPLWSEMVVTEADADDRLWPRLAAIADIGWSGGGDFKDFKQRMAPLRPLLDSFGIQYHRAKELDWD